MTDDLVERLLPCPFCGEDQPPHDDTLWVRCIRCGAETGWQPTKVVVDLMANEYGWVRRDRIKALEAQLAQVTRERNYAHRELAQKFEAAINGMVNDGRIGR